MLASGTVSYGEELSGLCDLGKIGGLVTKAISPEPRRGNQPQRIAETACGMINAIGLANVGLDRFVTDKVPFLQQLDTRVIVNIAGKSIDDYRQVVERLDGIDGIAAYELNLSCPNVKGECMIMGVSPDATREIVSSIRAITGRHLMVKLTPNVTSISTIALAAEEAGADSVSLINTVVGMAVDYRTRKPLLKNVTGGLSGPAIKPIALLNVKRVYEVAGPKKIPIIGQGGISSARDALEFIIAGATAVGVGTALFYDPMVCRKINDGIAGYLERHKVGRLADLVGSMAAALAAIAQAAPGSTRRET